MKPLIILFFLSIFISAQLDAQVRKPQRVKNKERIAFEYKKGVHKVDLPGTDSYLTIRIIGKKPVIKSISRTSNGKTYRLKGSNPRTCFLECPCGFECWEDPILKQCICVCKPCGGGGGGGHAVAIEILAM